MRPTHLEACKPNHAQGYGETRCGTWTPLDNFVTGNTVPGCKRCQRTTGLRTCCEVASEKAHATGRAEGLREAAALVWRFADGGGSVLLRHELERMAAEAEGER